MKKKQLNFQEKVLMFIKRTKPSSGKQALILTPILILVLALAGWVQRSDALQDPNLAKKESSDDITLTMVGDIMMGRHIKEVTSRHGEDFVFRNVQPFFDESDYVSGNYESPILTNDEDSYEKIDKSIHLYSEEEDLKTMKNAGFDVLNLANNHAMDYGTKGLEDTLASFEKNRMNYVGAGRNKEEAKHISYKEVDGVKISSVGFTDVYVAGMKAGKNNPGILDADPDVIFETIQEAKENADLVVVNAHWGAEYDVEPSERQQGLAKAMVDAGADIIIGHHPHVLQSFDVYNGSIIFYSLGNFVFDQGWSKTKNTAMVQYNLNKEGQATVDVIPMIIKEGSPTPTDNPWRMKRIYNDLTKYASNEGRLEKEDKKFQIKLDHTHVMKRSQERQNQSDDAPANNTEEAYTQQ
ncbi:CapA family protein [Priestia flexa]|uniref:CapA family protein n=1 Tax=Priestia flexa TaxID=86664 RepID=UPI002E20249F|nr:CapA family protein [Priestia flexa]